MNKKIFFLLVVLMSLSLIGIIFVQGFWIKNTVESKEEQFSFNAKQILRRVANEVENNELENYYFAMQELVDSLGAQADSSIINEIFEEQREFSDDVYQSYQGGLEEDFKLSTAFLDASVDTVQFKKLINRKVSKLVENDSVNEDMLSTTGRINRIFRMKDVEKEFIRSTVSEYTSRKPLHERVSKSYLEELIQTELRNRGMNTSFEYGIYGNGLATKVQSDNFELDARTTYRVPLFISGNSSNNYQLFVNFTEKKQVVLSSITLMAALSIIFTLIIVIAYSSALSQLIRQRQISEIKTDFINNMTHEFKTPIATINLALDAIKNPKVMNNPEKVAHYHRMIRDENKRMHAQVENVLRISRLEKNELDLKKERLDLHELIEEAITHIELIVEDKQGYVQTHFGALRASILANQTHFTNVIVNLLDNAVKYSPDAPKIDIYTENVKNYIVMKVRDQGSGMSKPVQKKIFEKFYREHTGDIHNVKGHGLGLAYAKRILDDHHGQISVESEKGKGSTFIIKLPLIS
ncbi:HAMP domain-containing histidine kinase [Salinimicrobium tongyeongense]|uniref:histidine kinase n=1 Tax=Salinimicrobium tongyeongense TaxID=2809707 RepID=A0ABY6NRM3_9FLAO|nr:HAMP domain-containing sensor histidine kinase [Salinimicrobium tongyeongense]UZH55301.1 HAMP domain-containing histidine kinase [Salinimicrobium tongyeongense]